jgi:predicted PurR-regulated permease PerM
VQTPYNPDAGVRPQTNWRRIVLFLFTLGLLVLCFFIALPFLSALTFATALAVVTHRPYCWLENRIKKPDIAAALAVVLVFLVVIAPAVFIGQSLGKQLYAGAKAVQDGTLQQNVDAALARYPQVNTWVERISTEFNLRDAAQRAADFATNWLGRFLGGSIAVVTQLFIMLFTLFFLYRDGRAGVNFLRSLLPLGEEQSDRLLKRLQDTTFATLQGSLTISAIQGTLGGVMFWILGVPGSVILAVIMAIAALIPSLGTFVVWAPVALYLGLTGSWVKAAVLTAYGVLVIGTVDNLLYPTLVGSRLQMHTVLVFFAVLGGIGLFGIPGLVLGPAVLQTTIMLLRVWREIT